MEGTEWYANVVRATNGYCVRFNDGESETVTVFEERSGTVKDEQLCFRDLCFFLKEHFGVFNDKHTGQFLDISVSGENE